VLIAEIIIKKKPKGKRKLIILEYWDKGINKNEMIK